ncbi:hypothetical protein BafPKo_0217 [Borreliella afzelii PKo]|uniref:Uncharacterized protein n=1 Tax=Borreliella afzelii (strain PKo) TaxID=390236 RepID=G0IR58_BORAP|nr:hypothetical protein BafPKo_0217 [Borreliella afzelii PKo]
MLSKKLKILILLLINGVIPVFNINIPKNIIDRELIIADIRIKDLKIIPIIFLFVFKLRYIF